MAKPQILPPWDSLDDDNGTLSQERESENLTPALRNTVTLRVQFSGQIAVRTSPREDFTKPHSWLPPSTDPLAEFTLSKGDTVTVKRSFIQSTEGIPSGERMRYVTYAERADGKGFYPLGFSQKWRDNAKAAIYFSIEDNEEPRLQENVTDADLRVRVYWSGNSGCMMALLPSF